MLDEPNKIIEGFEIFDEKQIGSGNTSVGYKARDIQNRQTVFIKKIDKEYYRLYKERCEQEIQAGIKLSRPQTCEKLKDFQRCVIRYIKTISSQDEDIYLVQELFEGINLEKYINEQHIQLNKIKQVSEKNFKKRFKEYELKCLQILFKCLKGLYFMDQNGLCHRDLSAANIMINEHDISKVKIIDLGSAKQILNKNNNSSVFIVEEDMDSDLTASRMSMFGFTPLSAPPEVLENNLRATQCQKLDVWSIGCVFYFMVVGYYPFYMAESQQQLRNILKGFQKNNEKIIYPTYLQEYLSDVTKDILQECLRYNFKDRSSYNALLHMSPFYEMENNETFYFSPEDRIFYETLECSAVQIQPKILQENNIGNKIYCIKQNSDQTNGYRREQLFSTMLFPQEPQHPSFFFFLDLSYYFNQNDFLRDLYNFNKKFLKLDNKDLQYLNSPTLIIDFQILLSKLSLTIKQQLYQLRDSDEFFYKLLSEQDIKSLKDSEYFTKLKDILKIEIPEQIEFIDLQLEVKYKILSKQRAQITNITPQQERQFAFHKDLCDILWQNNFHGNRQNFEDLVMRTSSMAQVINRYVQDILTEFQTVIMQNPKYKRQYRYYHDLFEQTSNICGVVDEFENLITHNDSDIKQIELHIKQFLIILSKINQKDRQCKYIQKKCKLMYTKQKMINNFEGNFQN